MTMDRMLVPNRLVKPTLLNGGQDTLNANRPPNAARIAEVVDARVKEVESRLGVAETVRVEWRSSTLDIPVIEMPTSMLFYNPETHRVRAQRTLDPVRDQHVTDDPWGNESQDYLHDLLRGDPADPLGKIDPTFLELKDDLAVSGQREPGIITRDGILVNGNTRRAALVDLEMDHIRVGVLPGDANWGDITGVELSLQLAKEFRRDYSFINELLAIEELAGRGKSDADIGRMFRRKPETILRSRWILAFIRDAIESSADGSVKAKLRLVDYERDKAQLEELYRAYRKLEASDQLAAERLLKARSAAVALDFAKTDIRHVGSDFLTKYLVAELPASFVPESREASTAGIPGLSSDIQVSSGGGIAEGEVATAILQASAVLKSESATPDDIRSASAAFSAYRTAFEGAIAKAKRDSISTQVKQAAPDHVLLAGDEIDLAIEKLVQGRASGLVDVEALDGALSELRDSLRSLAVQVGRSGLSAGEGIEWLTAVAAQRSE